LFVSLGCLPQAAGTLSNLDRARAFNQSVSFSQIALILTRISPGAPQSIILVHSRRPSAKLMKNIRMDKISNSTFRLKRFSHFTDLVRNMNHAGRPLRILDVGGEEAYWIDKIDLIQRPVEITLVNLWQVKTSNPNFISLAGDARSMKSFSDNSFDVVHSNSVIEHVGRWKDMRAMADEVRRLAPSYFLQTPYFWFPIEPHFRSVGFHWLPEPIRARLLMSRSHGFIQKSPDFDSAMSAVEGSVLLDRPMLADLFPDATIVFETVYGLRKSMMAIRAAPIADN